MKNEFRFKTAETDEKVTIRLYGDCMEIIEKDGFKTTLSRDTIIDAKLERENHSTTHDYGRVRVSTRVVSGVYVSKSFDVKHTDSYTVVKLRIKTSVMDDILLTGSEEELKDVLYYCVSKYRNVSEDDAFGYYMWLIVGYITLAGWIGLFIMGLCLDFLDTCSEAVNSIVLNIGLWSSAIAFLGLIPTCLLGFVYKDAKPEVKYPKKEEMSK